MMLFLWSIMVFLLLVAKFSRSFEAILRHIFLLMVLCSATNLQFCDVLRRIDLALPLSLDSCVRQKGETCTGGTGAPNEYVHSYILLISLLLSSLWTDSKV